MKMHEIIVESVSYESAMNSIKGDIGSPIRQLYNDLTQAANKYFSDADTLMIVDGKTGAWGLIKGGVTGRWRERFWTKSLYPNLKALCGYRKRNCEELSKYLSALNAQDYNERMKFKNIEDNLPGILSRLATSLKDKRLYELAQNWDKESNKLKQEVERLISVHYAYAKKHYNQDQDNSKKTAQVTGAQSSQAETVINQVLKDLPKKVAGEIRGNIAKSANKLAALSKELEKRGIKM